MNIGTDTKFDSGACYICKRTQEDLNELLIQQKLTIEGKSLLLSQLKHGREDIKKLDREIIEINLKIKSRLKTLKQDADTVKEYARQMYENSDILQFTVKTVKTDLRRFQKLLHDEFYHGYENEKQVDPNWLNVLLANANGEDEKLASILKRIKKGEVKELSDENTEDEELKKLITIQNAKREQKGKLNAVIKEMGKKEAMYSICEIENHEIDVESHQISIPLCGICFHLLETPILEFKKTRFRQFKNHLMKLFKGERDIKPEELRKL